MRRKHHIPQQKPCERYKNWNVIAEIKNPEEKTRREMIYNKNKTSVQIAILHLQIAQLTHYKRK